MHAAEISHVASAVFFRVGIHDFAIETRLGHAHAVVLSQHRSAVGDDDEEISGCFARRRKERTLASASLQSSHSNPCQSKSTW